MGCSASASGKNVSNPVHVSIDRPERHERHSPVQDPPPTLQYLVQCNQCGARLELCVPPETSPGMRIETSCAGCQRILQVLLGSTPTPSRTRLNREAGYPATNLTLLGGASHIQPECGQMGDKALKEAIAQVKRGNLVNTLPREKF